MKSILKLKDEDGILAVLLVDFAILAFTKQEWWVILLCISVLCAGFYLGWSCKEYHSKNEAQEKQEGQQAELQNWVTQGTNDTIRVSCGSIFWKS